MIERSNYNLYRVTETVGNVLALPLIGVISAVQGFRARNSSELRQRFIESLADDAKSFGDTSFAGRVGLVFFPGKERKAANQAVNKALTEYHRRRG